MHHTAGIRTLLFSNLDSIVADLNTLLGQNTFKLVRVTTDGRAHEYKGLTLRRPIEAWGNSESPDKNGFTLSAGSDSARVEFTIQPELGGCVAVIMSSDGKYISVVDLLADCTAIAYIFSF